MSRTGIEYGLNDIMDHVCYNFDRDNFAYINEFIRYLNKISHYRDNDEIMLKLQHNIRSHPAFNMLLEDPYTRHAYTKPRGFAGDAALIDFFYGFESGHESRTKVGRSIFRELMRAPSCDAVRYRRTYYAQFIDWSVNNVGRDILCIACGHFREGLFSQSVRSGAANVFAIDSDPLAISEAKNSQFGDNVNFQAASIVDFIRRRGWGRQYSAIYASGLLDYLNDKVAARFIEASLRCLVPGGVLSIANFALEIVERGYMDLVMDWKFIYRTHLELAQLTDSLNCFHKIYDDPYKSVSYLEISTDKMSLEWRTT